MESNTQVRRSVSVPSSLSSTEMTSSSAEVQSKFKKAVPFLSSFIRSVSTSSSSSVSDVELSDYDDEDDDIQEAYEVIDLTGDTTTDDETFYTTSEEILTSSRSSCHRALQIPEILFMIFENLDEFNKVPHEQAPRRRSPMSLRHAMLLYGDNERAREAWKQAKLTKKQLSNESLIPQPGAGLYSSLFVNAQWHDVAKTVLYKKLYFKSQQNWDAFASELKHHPPTKSSILVLHKIKAEQHDIDQLGMLGYGGNLTHLEFYTCPDVAPVRNLLAGGKLTKIVLPGCNRIDDRTCKMIGEMCPQLQHLDLRACERVSDKGLKVIARNCPQLQLLNVGRTANGELITYKGIKHIARSTSISTLGVAGCAVDDRSIWEIALRRGDNMERLSLNNCIYLTNASIPKILGYTSKLSVLELRGCTQITDMKPIVLFKKYRQRVASKELPLPLIEGCEVFELRMKEAEWMLEMEWSRQVFRDCLEWIYADDDDK